MCAVFIFDHQMWGERSCRSGVLQNFSNRLSSDFRAIFKKSDIRAIFGKRLFLLYLETNLAIFIKQRYSLAIFINSDIRQRYSKIHQRFSKRLFSVYFSDIQNMCDFRLAIFNICAIFKNEAAIFKNEPAIFKNLFQRFSLRISTYEGGYLKPFTRGGVQKCFLRQFFVRGSQPTKIVGLTEETHTVILQQLSSKNIV